ncbi:MAG: aryl-sulfate sulfotransferase [Lewinellaceae bacterium]|nr:aryl-sulfate sulfotransferase [Lewinellaceae bacterium]
MVFSTSITIRRMTRFFPVVLLLASSFLSQAQQTVGLFLNDSLAQNGYTLLAPSNARQTYLLDNCGRIVHSWQSNYIPGQVAYLLENGDLLRTARISGSFNSGGVGGRIERFSWAGTLLWAFNYATTDYHAHHDIEYLPNGNILLIAWEAYTRDEAIAQGRNPSLTPTSGVWYEKIVEIEPVGINQANIVWEWHMIDHLVQQFDVFRENYGVISLHPELLDINFKAVATGGNGMNGPGPDWVHLNSVDYNPALDQILINSRSLGEFYIIDHSTTTAEAAGHTGGKYGKGGDFLYRWGNPLSYGRGTANDQQLWGAHDSHWIPAGLPDAGKVLVFNNGQGRPTGNYSTVELLELPQNPDGSYTLATGSAFGPATPAWTYTAPQPLSFYSSNISGAQRMQNGNTLICEGDDGHIFEVDPAGTTHWEYVNPLSGLNPVSQGSFPGNNAVFRAYRYAPDYPAFAGKTLTSGAPLELNPLPFNCQIFDGTVALWTPDLPDPLTVFPNPVSNQLVMENPLGGYVQFTLTDLTGKRLLTGNSTDFQIMLDLSDFPPGMYILYPVFEKKYHLAALKIIKQ